MTEEVPAASSMPECNGSVPPEKGPLQVIGVIDEIAKSVGTVPYVNAETSPDAPPAKENQEENRNSLAEDIVPGDFDGGKQCEGKQKIALLNVCSWVSLYSFLGENGKNQLEPRLDLAPASCGEQGCRGALAAHPQQQVKIYCIYIYIHT
uniref:Uncharacterized protein n=1 Tax=Accipiter nisus TaxID=211598 RepID=A0A8B9N3T3_9AVES